MHRVIHSSWWVSAIALFCLVPCAFGQSTVNITMDSGGPYIMNNVYVGAYTATVNGQSAQIICDDYAHDTWIGESWTANVTNYSNLGSSTTLWSGLSNASTLYADAAWLATQMFSPANQNSTTQGYLAYALWSLFDSKALSGWSGGQLAGVNAWLAQIPNNLTAAQFSNFFIYTPNLNDSITCNGGPCPTAPPQEFLGFTVPEGGSPAMYLLLAGITCFGAMWLRRRQVPGAGPA